MTRVVRFSWVVLIASACFAQSPTFGRLPVYFTQNDGVHPDDVRFFVHGADKSLYFTRTGVTFALRSADTNDAWALKLDFVTEHAGVDPIAHGRVQAVHSHFVGPQASWKRGLPCYGGLVYRDVWPGIDIQYGGTVDRLKYAFLVQPGADPSQIRLRYRGATALTVTPHRTLRIETPVLTFEDAAPVAYQTHDGRRVTVRMDYVIAPDGSVGFELGDYDPAVPLVLDPAILLYCGLIGGGASDRAQSVAVDDHGNVYLAGTVYSAGATFPTRVGPFLTKATTGPTSFVAKVDPTGRALVYAGFIGGVNGANGYGVAVDRAGAAYVCGLTQSDEQSFPVKVGPSLTIGAVSTAGFIAKVAPSGRDLVYCGYIGSASIPYDVAVDAAGAAYLTGRAVPGQWAPNLPGPDPTFNGGILDAFVAKVHPSGSKLDYGGYIGGTGTEEGLSIAVDSSGAAYVIGSTGSDETSFPVAGGPDLTFNGLRDAFVAKVRPDGTALVYCGYLGGALDDQGREIAVGPGGEAYLAGSAYSDETTFPVTVGPDLTHNGVADAFVAKLDATGRTLVYCGFVGGSQGDIADGLAIDSIGRAYITGNTVSPDLPLRSGPSSTHSGNVDALVARIAASGLSIEFCGYIGGVGRDLGMDIAVGPTDAAYVAGEASALAQEGFPLKTGPGLTYSETADAFVAKVGCTHLLDSGTPSLGATVTFDLTALDSPGLTVQFGSSLGNGPLPIGRRKLGLAIDPMLQASVGGALPTVFRGYAGTVGSSGFARASVAIPPIRALVGVTFHTAAVTLHATSPQGIRAIANTVALTIVP